MPNFKKITHVIYDLDGLLLDTESIHAQVNQMMAKRYGKCFDTSIQLKIMGRNSLDSARILIELLELPLTPQAYLAERNPIIYELFPAAQPLPGAMQLTQHLYQHGTPQAIATSTSQIPFSRKTTHHQDWLKLFDCIVLGDDPAIQAGKPAPDSFLITAERLGADPAHCLVFEDSLAGVAAAKRAGMSVVAVPPPEMVRSLYQEADQILNSLLDFKPHLWQLPTLSAGVQG